LKNSSRKFHFTLTALGKCHGNFTVDQENDLDVTKNYTNSRFSVTYAHDAVEIFSKYDLIIAMENSYFSDYISEKLVNVLLAKKIPIYIGAPNIQQYFHSNSFFTCSSAINRRIIDGFPRWVENCVSEILHQLYDYYDHLDDDSSYQMKKKLQWRGKNEREKFHNFLKLFHFHEITYSTSYSRKWLAFLKQKFVKLLMT
jgi:hypothetical protein